jgi:putative transposase
MPKGLRRLHGGGDLHFITCSCYRRLKFLGSASRRDLFLEIFEEVREKYDFVVVGYVVMPEHFHILISEPRIEPLAIAMQVLKQRVSFSLCVPFWESYAMRVRGQHLIWRDMLREGCGDEPRRAVPYSVRR